jgi:hypothetical protein
MSASNGSRMSSPPAMVIITPAIKPVISEFRPVFMVKILL